MQSLFSTSSALRNWRLWGQWGFILGSILTAFYMVTKPTVAFSASWWASWDFYGFIPMWPWWALVAIWPVLDIFDPSCLLKTIHCPLANNLLFLRVLMMARSLRPLRWSRPVSFHHPSRCHQLWHKTMTRMLLSHLTPSERWLIYLPPLRNYSIFNPCNGKIWWPCGTNGGPGSPQRCMSYSHQTGPPLLQSWVGCHPW